MAGFESGMMGNYCMCMAGRLWAWFQLVGWEGRVC